MNRPLNVWYFRDEEDDDTDDPVTVRTGAALDALLDDVFANEQPHPTVVVAQDRPTLGPLNLPDHQLKFSADPATGVAALYLMGPRSFEPGTSTDTNVRAAWVTRGAPTDAVTLWLDRDADLPFPRDSVVPLGKLRDALHEFMRTAQRPSCLDWQEVDAF